ncbi:MAG TPA: c-type cytochrome, partial [Anaerolineae bacterium]|nr:c-type cytochrome [Anaerolineae bacterium]
MVARAILILLTLLAIAALLLALAWHEPARMTNKEAAIAARAVENGAGLYRSYCAGCHGVAGRGIPGLAPALNHPDFFQRRLAEVGYPGALRSYIEAAVAAGRPVNQGQYNAIMPAWGQAYGGSLRADEMRDIASFILRWEAATPEVDRAATPTPPTTPASAAIERGKAVFYGPAGCLGCHGEPGKGGVSGPDMAGIARRAAEQIPGLSAEQVIRQSILAPGAMISAGCRSQTCPDLMPRDYAARLRQADVDALVGYLLTLHDGGPEIAQPTLLPPAVIAALATKTPVPTLRLPNGDRTQGKELFERECAPCHGASGQGGWASSLDAVFTSIDPYQYVRAAMEQGIP